METGVALLDVYRASGTVLAVTLHPVLSLLVIGIAVYTLRVVLVAREAGVPRNLMRETHLEATFIATDVGIWKFGLFVDLPAVACGIQTRAEVWFLRQVREEEIVVVPGKYHFESACLNLILR
jgi:hypothetical protein